MRVEILDTRSKREPPFAEIVEDAPVLGMHDGLFTCLPCTEDDHETCNRWFKPFCKCQVANHPHPTGRTDPSMYKAKRGKRRAR